MTYIKATWQEIEDCGNEFGRCSNLLDQSNRTVRNAKRSLSLQIKMQTNYDDQLEALCTRMTRLQQCMTQLQNTAVNVARMYRDTELRIRGEENSTDASDEAVDIPWDLISGILSSTGLFGSLVGGVIDFATSDDPAWVRITDALGSVFDNAEDIAQWLGAGAEVVEDIAAVAPWISAIAGLVTTGYGNWEEYQNGEIDGGRAFLETITEFAVENGIQIALVAACGGPGIVAGVATTAVMWIADYVTESVWGESFTEVASDALIDGGQWVCDQLESTAATITEGISDGAEWLGDRLDDAGDFFGDMFDGFGRDRARDGGSAGGGHGGGGFSIW